MQAKCKKNINFTKMVKNIGYLKQNVYIFTPIKRRYSVT
jgi:hypothetical protein